MIIAFIIIASLVAYLAIGGLVARKSIPALWERANEMWGFSDRYARESVVGGTICRTLFWPLLGPYELLAQHIDACNPKEVRRRQREQDEKIAQQQKQIRDLERELGIGVQR